ncbi:hypothetical protein BDF22DRAFT_683760 [Syncephalis plumigaleata]|nr:hypothetical protein BDF22DRAFT_683760 [Syncephalis plumigaleata]
MILNKRSNLLTLMVCLAGVSINVQHGSAATTAPIPPFTPPVSPKLSPAQQSATQPGNDLLGSLPLHDPFTLGQFNLQIIKHLPPDSFKVPRAIVKHKGIQGEMRCIPRALTPLPPIYVILQRVHRHQEARKQLLAKNLNADLAPYKGQEFITGLINVFDTPDKSHECYIMRNSCAQKLIDATNLMSIDQKKAMLPLYIGKIIQGVAFMARASIIYKNFGPNYICLNKGPNGSVPTLFVLPPDQSDYNVAEPGRPAMADTAEERRKKLTWAVGAVLYKMLSGRDAKKEYTNSKALAPEYLYQSPEIGSLLAETNLNNGLTNRADVHAKAQSTLSAAFKDAQGKLEDLVQLMDELMLPNIRARPLLYDVIVTYGAKLGISK